jgi:hypothetical protein
MLTATPVSPRMHNKNEELNNCTHDRDDTDGPELTRRTLAKASHAWIDFSQKAVDMMQNDC